MRKGVAVPYVIMLILGVAVIALIGIWFVTSGGKFGKASAELECKKAILIICTQGISVSPLPSLHSDDIVKCANANVEVPANINECKSKGYIT